VSISRILGNTAHRPDEETAMHHAIGYYMAQARIAGLRRHAGSGIRTVPFPAPPRPLSSLRRAMHPLAESAPPAA
jgi:hypothetical protein